VTLAEIRSEVRRRLDEVNPGGTFWSDEDIDKAIGEGEDEFADACEWYERFQTIDILENRPYYDLRTVIRFDFLVAGPVFNDTTSRWLEPLSPNDLDRNDRRWEMVGAEPQFFMMRGLWWLGMWPRKNSEQGSVKQYYRALPRHMSEDDDEPGFHRVYHYGLVEYAVSDLLAQDAETDLALSVWKLYQGYEAALASYIDHRAYIPMQHGNAPSRRS
jgi:hypothetical protein